MKILIPVILCSVFSILILGACGMKDAIENSTESSVVQKDVSVETVESKVDLVNDEIGQLIESDDYIKASIEEKEEFASILLNKLENQGYIKGLYYDKENSLFSFQYADGTLGGIQMDDFNKEIDGLLMN